MHNGIKNKKIIIDFNVGQSDNPKVNAIILVSGGKENTHYAAYNRYIKELETLRTHNQEQ